MITTLLSTKLYVPPVRRELVSRPRLIERLNTGLCCRLTLISAPAGFGKTTLLSEWASGCGPHVRVAWLSLDEDDNDLVHFLTYLVAALQTVEGSVGQGLPAPLQSPEAANAEVVLTSLLNRAAQLPDNLVLVLDDYQVIESQPIDHAIIFLLEHLPPQMHLVIASRADPSLPLSRLRAAGQMTEIRAADLRFAVDEVATFLSKVMGRHLSIESVAALENRTEGWIAGLQLAALSMHNLKRDKDVADFINRFTGSNRYIQDYLADEVLQQRPKGTKDFLLQTSILSHLSGPLCDTVTKRKNSQAILEALEAANLFITPLDNRRCWYRYHPLFADLLRQRLEQQQPDSVPELHTRASAWYEENGLDIEAFRHAAAAHDFERATRLVEGDEHPLHNRGALTPVLNWLESLPASLLAARPSLCVMHAEVLMTKGRLASAEAAYQAAEEALQEARQYAPAQDLQARIANGRAWLAGLQHRPERMIVLSRRALEVAHPDNLAIRAAASLNLGYAYQLQGDRIAAGQAFSDALANAQTAGHIIITMFATERLANLQAAQNRLRQAAETYQRALQLAGVQPLPYIGDAHLGLAQILYEWNDLEAAQRHGHQSLQLARQIEHTDKSVASEVFLARLKLAQGDMAGAAAALDEVSQSVRREHFAFCVPEVVAAQVLTLLRQGDVSPAAHLADAHGLPASQARVHLAQGNAAGALAVLEPLRRQMEAYGWLDETLKVMVLQAVALHAHGEEGRAVQVLGDAMALAEPGGFVRTFIDEGGPMAQLLVQAAAQGIMPEYANRLLAAFESEKHNRAEIAPPSQPLIESLSQREVEVLQLVAQGLSNREVGDRLFLALDTIKGHNRRIYAKLGVRNRTQAINKARSLGILPPQ